MDKLISALLGIVALINLLPVFGVLSAARVGAMYRVRFAGPDLAILMRHRAVLFAVVGGLLVAAMFRPELRWPAIIAAAVSMGAFVVLAWMEGGYNAAIRRVIVIDLAAFVPLAAAAVLIASQRAS